MRTLNRRELVKTTAAAGAAAIAGAAASSHAGASGSAMLDAGGPNLRSCVSAHQVLGNQLSSLIADPAVADNAKNHAIKTAACPDCGTAIAPSGLGLHARTWL